MKKTVAAALAAAVVVGSSATTFAAANPFSDVPAGHWAYQAVTALADDGIVEGYGDGTYRGDRLITRYEMAQMIAKALARTDRMFDQEAGLNQSGHATIKRNYHAVKADLDRLSAEFRDELDALGVRVAELEKYADKVIWQGKIEYTYKSARTDNIYDRGKTKVNQDDWIFRFEPIMVVNSEQDDNGKIDVNGVKYKSIWTLRARIDAHADLSHDTNSSFTLERGWAQGDYENFQIKVGRQPLYTNEDGIVWDTEYTGGEVTYFSDRDGGFRATVYGGRLKDGKVIGSVRNAGSWNGRQDGVSADDRWNAATGRLAGTSDDPSSFWAINLQYDRGGNGLFGGAGYYHIKDSDLRNSAFIDLDTGDIFGVYSRRSDTDEAKIWSVNAGYRLGKAQLWGAYAKNSEADYENYSWQALLKYGDLYGGGNQGTHKGQWAVWAGYKRLGSNASLQAINWDDAFAGTKGLVAGASWAPMDRIVFIAKYFKGKYITGGGDAERLFGRVEFFY